MPHSTRQPSDGSIRKVKYPVCNTASLHQLTNEQKEWYCDKQK